MSFGCLSLRNEICLTGESGARSRSYTFEFFDPFADRESFSNRTELSSCVSDDARSVICRVFRVIVTLFQKFHESRTCKAESVRVAMHTSQVSQMMFGLF